MVIKVDPNPISLWVCTVTGKLQFLLILLWCSYASSMPCHCHLLLVLLSSTFVQRLRSSEKRETFKAGGDSVKWVIEFLLTGTNWARFYHQNLIDLICIFLNWHRVRYGRVQKSIENIIFRPKMAIFWRAGMREGGLPLPLAFQYLILMIWKACDLNLVMISSLASK